MLDVFLRFGEDGATEEAVYCFVTFYSDANICYDPKFKNFYSPHGVTQA